MSYLLKRKARHHSDYVFIVIIAFLVIFGLVMLTSASSDLGKIKFNDSYYYLKHQLSFGLLVGFFGFLISSLIYYRFWEKFAFWLLIINILMLLLVFSPLGVKIKGSERWLDFGFFSFQPAEILKFSFISYLAAWLSRNQNRSQSFSKGFLPFLIISGITAFILLLQPATSTTFIILFTSLTVYFSAGAKFRFVFGAIGIGLIVAILFVLFIPKTDYRYQRFLSFLNPQADPLGKGYHLNQALIAIGSGGLTGVGYGQSTSKINYLPEPIGDSIFAVIAEELGFIGSIFLIFLFIMLVWRSFLIGRKAPDLFSRCFAFGFGALIGIQAFVNIAAISGVIPPTGVPLPFISFGGTALAVYLTIAGVLVNISKYRL